MMQALRDNMKHIMLLVAVAFAITIVFSWGMGGFEGTDPIRQGLIGEINGQKIQYWQYMEQVNQHLEFMRMQNPDMEITEMHRQRAREEAWNSFLQEILLAEAVKKENLLATDEEVLFRMRYSPPPVITTAEQFQTDGQFDFAKYQQALSNPQYYGSWIGIENQLRYEIPRQKLLENIKSSVRVNENEIREVFKRENEKVKIQAIAFRPADFTLEENAVSEQEIERYYRQNQEEFRQAEQRKIKYIIIPFEPSRSDSMASQDEVDLIMRRLDAGEDFASLAMTYSQDETTAEEGGDLGFFDSNTMVEAFSEAAFNAETGEIVGPVETQFGLHIIQVMARRTRMGEEQVHARHILIKYETGNQTAADIENLSQDVSEEARKARRLEHIAGTYSLEVKETPLFERGPFIPGLGMAANISALSFNEKRGFISPPLQFNEDLIVFQVSEIQKSSILPLEDVKSRISFELENRLKLEKARHRCIDIHQKIADGMDFQSAADEDSKNIIESGFITLTGTIPGIGRQPEINGKAFRMNTGGISEPVNTEIGSYIIRVAEKQPISETAFQSERNQIKARMLEQKQQLALSAWFENLQGEAKIKDYRDRYF